LSTTTDGAIWDFQLSAGIVYPDQPWALNIITSNSTGTGGGNPVPEPGTILLFGTGIAGLTAIGRRKKN